MRNRALTFGLLVFFLTTLAPVVHAQAQTPYPPTTLPSVCLSVSGNVRLVDGILEVLFEGQVTLFGPGGAGCALPGETVDGSAASDPVFLGSTTGAADGSYSISATLPSSITPGNHELIADFGPGRAQLVQPILVVTSFAAPAAGILPKTGGNIASNTKWALLLIVVGISFVVFARRYGMLQLAGIRQRVSPGMRSLRRTPRAHTTDLSEVDTGGFVPGVPRTEHEVDEDDWPFFTPPDS